MLKFSSFIYIIHFLCLLQGAVVGLLAGLAMAFWIGIGSFIMHMSPAAPLPTTALPPLDNITAATVMTTLAISPTSKPR